MTDAPQPGSFPPPPYQGYPPQPGFQQGYVPQGTESKRITAGVLSLLLGAFGVHKFYLGYTKEGVLQILLTIFTCGVGAVMGTIEGIVYLVKSDAEFIQTYQVGRKGWF